MSFLRLDLHNDNWIRVPSQFYHLGFGLSKEVIKDSLDTGVGYYSVPRDGYRFTCSHDKNCTISKTGLSAPGALNPVLEMVQEVHDLYSFYYLHEVIPMHFEKQQSLLPVFQY
jgi:hypothetical protein